jgi:hypothetical protein
VKFLLRLVYPFPILTINDEYQALGAGVVVSPEGTNLVLTPNIPHVKLDVLVCDSLNIETNCRIMKSKKGENDVILQSGPVGIVVTDWLSLSLYKIAVGLLLGRSVIE